MNHCTGRTLVHFLGSSPPLPPPHCGTKPGCFETSNHSLSLKHGSDQACKWMSAAERTNGAHEQSKQGKLSKWVSEQISTRTSEWPSTLTRFLVVLNHSASATTKPTRKLNRRHQLSGTIHYYHRSPVTPILGSLDVVSLVVRRDNLLHDSEKEKLKSKANRK